eukprot:TRINITY_DN1217_c0_g1_i5.p1 TRINITY_DN1217_c0_g1~~TRINITY_DN1217_c0_g1_i5.p1  ORF type:complete len:289 (+),score=42.06 TRINITY_DN1217_c0_g1_i5:919-1785(+)
MIRGLKYLVAKRWIATGSWDKSVKVFSVAKNGLLEHKKTLNCHSKRVNAVEWSESGLLISGSMDQMVRLTNPETGQVLVNFRGHQKNVFAVAVTHDEKYIASASADKNIIIWDVDAQEEIGKLSGHKDWACALAFSPYSRRLVSGGRDALIKVWNSESGDEIETLKGHTNCILQLRYSPDGKLIVSASEDKTLKVWDAITFKEKMTLVGHTHEVTCCAFFKQSSRWLVSGSSDKSVRIWDLTTGKQEWVYFVEGGTIAIDTTEDGYIVVGDSAGCLHVLSLHNINLSQ